MSKLALTIDGRMTTCTATPENIGKGRCNHLAHAKDGESNLDFTKRIEESKISKIEDLVNKSTQEKLNLIEKEVGLNHLINDKDPIVKETANKKLKEINNKNNTIIKEDYDFEGYLEDNSCIVGQMLDSGDRSIDDLINDEDEEVRMEMASRGYGLEKLADDKDSLVRIAVVRQGYKLEKFVNDKDFVVRMEVANQGYALDKLVDDEEAGVREVVASKGFGLDKLINDTDPYVRMEVAKQGYGLDKLVNDENENVRNYAKKLMENKK